MQARRDSRVGVTDATFVADSVKRKLAGDTRHCLTSLKDVGLFAVSSHGEWFVDAFHSNMDILTGSMDDQDHAARKVDAFSAQRAKKLALILGGYA
jgi:hypothetical protein